MQKSVTIHHFDAHGATIRHEQLAAVRYEPAADPDVLGTVTLKDDLGRLATYDAATGASLSGRWTRLSPVSLRNLRSAWRMERRQLRLPGTG